MGVANLFLGRACGRRRGAAGGWRGFGCRPRDAGGRGAADGAFTLEIREPKNAGKTGSLGRGGASADELPDFVLFLGICFTVNRNVHTRKVLFNNSKRIIIPAPPPFVKIAIHLTGNSTLISTIQVSSRFSLLTKSENTITNPAFVASGLWKLHELLVTNNIRYIRAPLKSFLV